MKANRYEAMSPNDPDLSFQSKIRKRPTSADGFKKKNSAPFKNKT